MFIKKLSFCLCVVSLFLFNYVDAGLREDISKKKYAFSEPVLDEVKAFNEVVIKGDYAEEVFKLMWDDAENGNEKVQEKLVVLFSKSGFYERAKTRVPLLNDINTYSLDSLINIGIFQKKSWAFYEKALKENNPMQKYILLNEAINNLDQYNNQEIYAVYVNAIKNNEVKINEQKNNFRNYNKNKLKNFIEDLKNHKSGHCLYEFYMNGKDSSDTVTKKFSSDCLYAAADLGYGRACQDLLKIENNNKKDKYALKLVKTGNPQAMHALGGVLIKKSSNEDKKEGINLLLMCAEKTSDVDLATLSIVIAAETLMRFAVDEEDKLKVFKLALEADQLGHINGMEMLGDIYLKGYIDNVPNFDEAEKYLRKAAEKGSYSAMLQYGEMVKVGFEGREPDEVEGNNWIQKTVDAGYFGGMNYYGASFLNKWNKEKQVQDLKNAYNWFLKASETGCIASLHNIGRLLCLVCPGFDTDLIKAEKYLLQAIDNGNIRSLCALASLYTEMALKENSKVQKNKLHRKAARYLNEAYESGYFKDLFVSEKKVLEKKELIKFNNNTKNFNIGGYELDYIKKDKVRFIYNLAFSYDNGLIGSKTKQDKIKAFQLFLCAAKNGDLDAMYRVGQLLLKGVGCVQDIKKTFKWFLRAAEKGCAYSMVDLAYLLAFSTDGEKTEQNYKDALFWLEKAKFLGESRALMYLEMCQKSLDESVNQSKKQDVSDDEIEELVKENNAEYELKNIDLTELKLEDDEECSDVNNVLQNENIVIENIFLESKGYEEEENLNIINENQQYNNPKHIRDQLRQIGLLKKNQESEESDIHHLKLSDRNQSIVDMLLDKSIKNKNIDYTQLVNLFKDPFFKNQVQVNPTKSGCIVTAKNYKTLDYVVASTHKKHNKTYDGLNPFFARDLIKVLMLFGLIKN